MAGTEPSAHDGGGTRQYGGVDTGRLKRTLPVVKLTSRTIGEFAVAGLRGKLSGPESIDFHARTAERYYELLGNSKGALMKAAQMLSIVSAGPVIPAELQSAYQTALGRLRDDAPPMAPELAEQVLLEELGPRALENFAEFDWEPLAAASIGQVHAAKLRDGGEVAVKIQYPGVDEAIRNDLQNGQLLASFIALMSGFLPRRFNTDIRGVAREISGYILQELDYRQEAANQAEFATLYRKHPFIRIPEVILELSTTRVLVQQLCRGGDWTEALVAEQPLRDAWAEAIWRFVYGSYLRFGLLNLDPHPGNLLLHEDGGVSFLDFGSVKRFPREHVDLYAEIVRSAIRGDAPTTWRLCVEAGCWRASDPVAPEEVLAYWREPFRYVWDEQPFTVTPEYVARWTRARCSPFGPAGNAASRMTLPRDTVAWPRVEGGIASMLGDLRATNDWASLHEEYLDDGVPITEMGKLDHAYFTEAAVSRR